MAKKRIFVSYDYDNDRHYKNLLLAWDKNGEFDFGFSDQSADVSIDSHNTAAIKRAISAKINASTRLLCIVGSKTHHSDWVSWEIGKAVELRKKIIAVKTAARNASPHTLLRVGAEWAMSFTFQAIKDAIEKA